MIIQVAIPAVVIGICMLIARILLRKGQMKWSIAFAVVGTVAGAYLLHRVTLLMQAGLL